MATWVLKLGAMAIYGSLVAVSWVGDFSKEAPTKAGYGDDAPIQTTAGAEQRPVTPGEMSEEERERRRRECETLYDSCCDWCGRSKQGRACYDECMKKQADCWSKIPD
jgi:hypothetical protein